jgi:hypothetical protein
MIRVLVTVILLCTLGAGFDSDAQPARRVFQGRLRSESGAMRYPDGARFPWRGLTSFRLVEMMAQGQSSQVTRYLAWAAEHDITVVRVLTMTQHMFTLDPARGRAALPALLSAAQEAGLYVEVVALADTASFDVDLDAHVRAIGEIASRHENAIVEIANEPDHPTQRKELADHQRLLALARLVPDRVPVALGSGTGWQDPLYAASTARANTYLTAHFPRGDGEQGWRPHVSLRSALRLQQAHRLFVVDDEPIGAGRRSQAGARDADAARWFGHGVLARVLRMGSTFHSDAGLHATIPEGNELACFEAWRRGMMYVPADAEDNGISQDAGETPPDNPEAGAVAGFDAAHAVHVFGLVDGSRGWILALGVSEDPRVTLTPGWRITHTDKHDRVWILQVSR